MNKQQIKKYFYAKGVLAGVMLQNILMFFFLIIISSKDGFEVLGLMPIWFIVVIISLASIVYFYLADKEVSRNE
jgi:ABC-type polysaccharide/polyol phosphate export permease